MRQHFTISASREGSQIRWCSTEKALAVDVWYMGMVSRFCVFSDHAADLVVQMRQWYELTVRAVLGDGARDDKEVTILNRTLKIIDDGLEYSADRKHEQQIRAKYNIGSGSKGLDAPAEKEELPDGSEVSRDLPLAQTICRRIGSTCQLRRKRRADKCQIPGPVARLA